VDIEATIERVGRSMTTTSARLRQEGQILQVAHAASSTTRPGLSYDGLCCIGRSLTTARLLG
jgi:hypothetical protein